MSRKWSGRSSRVTVSPLQAGVEAREPLLAVQDLLGVISFGGQRKRLSSDLLHEAELLLRLPQG